MSAPIFGGSARGNFSRPRFECALELGIIHKVEDKRFMIDRPEEPIFDSLDEESYTSQ